MVGGFIHLTRFVVDVPRLIVAVTYINPFGIVKKSVVLFALFAELVDRFMLGVGIAEVTGVEISRGCGDIISIGVHQTAGRIHRARQNAAHTVVPRSAGTADQDRRIDALFLQEAQFHRIAGVDHHNHLLEVAGSDQIDHFLFRFRQLQIVTVLRSAVLRGFERKVAAFAAGTGQYDQRHIGEFLRLLQQILAKLAGSRLA
ncbi:hypothetical protein D1872_232770 [compost metagenome]